MKKLLPLIFSLLYSYSLYPQELDSLLDLSLEELMTLEITTVSKISEKSSMSAAVVTVVTHEMIRNYGYRTVYDVLMHTPGFFPIQDVNDKIVGMRGIHASTQQKFLLLINGKRITENLWNLTDIDYNISLTNVKQIEIIRGPGSAVYGRAALTAVINIVTFSGTEMDALNYAVSLGNYGYKNVGFAFASPLDEVEAEVEVFAHFVGIEGQEADVPASEDGAQNPVAGQTIIDKYKFPTGSFGASYTNNNWDVSFFYMSRNYQQQRSANGALSWQNIRQREIYEQRIFGEEHQYIIADIDRKFLLGATENAVKLNTTFSRLKLRENPRPLRDMTLPAIFDAQDSTEYSMGELFEFDIESYRLGLEYFGNYSTSNSIQLLWGFEAYLTQPLSDKFTSNFVSYLDPATGKLVKQPTEGGLLRENIHGTFDKLRREYLYSAYTEVKIPVSEYLIFSAGGRYDLHVKGDDFRQEEENYDYPDENAELKRQEVEKTSSQFSPRLAVAWQPLQNELLTLKAIYNKSFIAPGYFYRYADPSTSYAGGPWLKAETLDNYMVEIQSYYNKWGAKIAGFINVNKNLLTRDNSLTPARYTSLGELAMQGVETEVFFKNGFLNIFANYSYLQGNRSLTNDSSAETWLMDNESIKNFPLHYGTLGITAHLLPNRLSASVINRWYGEIQSPVSAGQNAGTVATLDAQFIPSLTVRYQPAYLKAADLTVSVYNLLDKELKLGGTVKLPYYQAGRWFNFSLIFSTEI